MVDLHRHWAARNKGVEYVWNFLADAAPYCTPMSSCRVASTQNYKNDRFAFGYARDNNAYPPFLLHPVRFQQETFTLISVVSGEAFPLDVTPEIRILSLEHFYDAFRAAPMRSLRPAVINAYNIGADVVTPDLRITRQAATALKRPDVRDLVLPDEPEQPDGSPPESPKKTPQDVRDQDGDSAMSQGSWSSSELHR